MTRPTNCTPPAGANARQQREWADAWHPGPSVEHKAKRLCRGCPAVSKCLTFALDFEDPVTGRRLEGVWGGTTTADRANIRDNKGIERQTGRRLKPCGTRAAYHRHLYRGEKPCDACLASNNADSLARHHRKKAAKNAPTNPAA